MAEDDNTASETYELYGPKNYSMGEIAALVDREILKHRRHMSLPKVIMKPIATLLNKAIWWQTTSADRIEREFIDQQIDPKAKTFKDLGIEPGDISNFTFHYLVSTYTSHLEHLGRVISDAETHSVARISRLVVLRFTAGH